MQVPQLALALMLVSLSPRFAVASTPPSARGTPPVVAGAEEKQRVPKPPPEKPRTKSDKPASSSTSSDSDDDDSADFWMSCLGDCLGACLEGGFDAIFEAVFSPKSSKSHPHAAPALAESTDAFAPTAASSTGEMDSTEAATPYEPHAWAKYDVGFLRAYVPGDSVVLRRSPSDPDSVLFEVNRLPDGTRVLVQATQTGGAGTMLEVRPVDVPGSSGWVFEKSVRDRPSHWLAPPAESAAPENAPPDTVAGAGPGADALGTRQGATRDSMPPLFPRPETPRDRLDDLKAAERWAVVFAAGPAAIDNPELAKEYSTGALALEAEYLRHLTSAWVVGAGAGYRGYSGTPQVEYVGATEIDAPEHSRFRLTYGILEFGQRHAWAAGLRLGYMLGPVLGYVHEDATVHVLDAGTRAPLGARHEVLGRWAAGGGGTTWLGVGLPFPLELGIRFRVFGLAWTGGHEKSLTSDYTDAGLLHIDGAVILTHAGH